MRYTGLVFTLCLLLQADTTTQQARPATYADPDSASATPAFRLQGEYLGTATDAAGGTAPIGLQVVAVAEDHVHVVVHPGGLPGAGSDGRNAAVFSGHLDGTELRFPAGPVDRAVVAGGTLTGYRGPSVVWDARRATRSSPTLGAEPPPGAVVLFDGKDTEAFDNGQMTADGLLIEGTRTRQSFRDFTLHLEFRLPYKPTVFPGNQDRGNSGLYIFDRYEVQILDSFGLHYYAAEGWQPDFARDWRRQPPSNRTQWGGALYLTRPPDINMSLPPLAWQTYDIDFTAPRFDADGRKSANARITIRHNGVLIHSDVELMTGTGAGSKRPEIPEGPLVLQDHANPVRFRNIWLVTR